MIVGEADDPDGLAQSDGKESNDLSRHAVYSTKCNSGNLARLGTLARSLNLAWTLARSRDQVRMVSYGTMTRMISLSSRLSTSLQQ